MFDLNENAKMMLEKRYLLKDENGNVTETFEDFFKRVSNCVGKNKKEREIFYDEISNCRFIPNTPALINAGKQKPQLSACFVLPINDNMESIFTTLKESALIHKSGGGVGINFSNLRARNSFVSTSTGTASGPVSFMSIFDKATGELKQGGVRRGANMGILDVYHNDILEFIDCKIDTMQYNNFNISVSITNNFMNDLENNPNKLLPCGISVLDLWNKIIFNAWQNGEPGVVFIDTVNADNPRLPKYLTNEEARQHPNWISSSNPCGESFLESYEACILGSIDVSKFVNEEDLSFDYIKLEKTVKHAIDFLDNTIDISVFPVEEISKKVLENRKIGLGIMGWADSLFKMKIRYGSNISIKLAEELMYFILKAAWKRSCERGVKLGSCEFYEEDSCIKMNKILTTDLKPRNLVVTTIAPTGSISIIAGCSSGIEPIFAWSYIQNRLDIQIVQVHSFIERFLGTEKIQELIKASNNDVEILNNNIQNLLPEYFVTTNDILPEEHVRMQAAFQNYVCNAISKTINLPYSATIEDVDKIYRMAWNADCKGITVYRDGSRNDQVLARKKDKVKSWERPYILESKTFRVKIDVGQSTLANVYVVISLDKNNKPIEVFVTGLDLDNVSSYVSQNMDTISRMASMALRHGVPLNVLIKQFNKINRQSMYSIPNKIASILSEFLEENERPLCKECGGVLIFQEGCAHCKQCGHSRCN